MQKVIKYENVKPINYLNDYKYLCKVFKQHKLAGTIVRDKFTFEVKFPSLKCFRACNITTKGYNFFYNYIKYQFLKYDIYPPCNLIDVYILLLDNLTTIQMLKYLKWLQSRIPDHLGMCRVTKNYTEFNAFELSIAQEDDMKCRLLNAYKRAEILCSVDTNQYLLRSLQDFVIGCTLSSARLIKYLVQRYNLHLETVEWFNELRPALFNLYWWREDNDEPRIETFNIFMKGIYNIYLKELQNAK